MLVSFNWLKEFVEISETPNEIAELLTMGGIEIEAVDHVGAALSQIIVAKVLNIRKHPKSDNLNIAEIEFGDGKTTNVVCGAPNLEIDQIVPFAPVGSTLPSGLLIQDREIRGVSSPGMLCSEKELGFGDDSSGLLVLDTNLKPGISLTEALPFIEDYILETSVTPNRGDCLSILGTAREIAALLDRKWHLPEFDLKELGSPISDHISIQIKDPHLCHRYVAKRLEGITIKPSSLQIRLKLTRCGVRPISNIVDATNLVLLECGQPLHAFDYDLLEEAKIVVSRAAPGEKFITLDGIERNLPENGLMIRDGKRAVALAGIMGGQNSEIISSTRNVLIESAFFEPFGIRRTSKKLGLSTEASYRFERGIDPVGTLWAANRCAYLMHQFAGGIINQGDVDEYPTKMKKTSIPVSTHNVNGLLGLDLKTQDMVALLKRLNISIEEEQNTSFTCIAPSWRWDIERDVDIAEEVARIAGYETIPVTMPGLHVAPDHTQERYGTTRKIADLVQGSGFTEVITMSFISQDMFQAFDLSGTAGLSLLNPLSEDATVLRSSLIPGLISVMKRNLNFRNADLKLYELGRTFVPESGKELPREDLKLGLLGTGNRYPFLWNCPRDEKIDFFDIKGALENILEVLDIEGISYEPSQINFLHPGKSADILLGGEKIGYLGELSPISARAYEIEERVYICEVLLEPLFTGMRKDKVFRPIPRYPYIERDLSIIVEEKVSGDVIKRLISRLGHDIITSVNLFDLYQGESIPKGHQSVAFRIRYQSEDRTLTDEEVQEVHSRVVEALSHEFGATIRE